MATRESRASEGSLRSKLLRALQRSPYEPYRGSSGYSPPKTTSSGPAYTSKAAAELVEVTDRQLDYWDSVGLVRPSRPTSGGQLLYSDRDLVELRLVKVLLEQGVELKQVRTALNDLRKWTDRDFFSARLRIAGDGVAVLTGEEEDESAKIFDFDSGQVGRREPVELDRVKAQVDRRIADVTARSGDEPTPPEGVAS